ncbi:F510_1955 family glycosylhydrolase [Micromonospora sp. CPCC 206061]|uniref:F510_1955 family glycosylhydrolase n=1 Tax=Micromonospora sp. CPCC 206061 TaxID=3122410 RepID=UPI002FF17EA6
MPKTTPAKRSRTGQRNSHPRGAVKRRWLLIAGLVVVALAVSMVVWAVGRPADRGGDAVETASARIEHVHGLGVNPADGALYAATHHGVFRIPDDGAAARVGDGQQDTMGFTIVGANHFIASGHPAPDQGGPEHLGLIESTDGGLAWRSLSLAGGADFHALRFRHGQVYGYNSVSGQLLVSRDRTNWQTRSTIAVRDFVVSPSSDQILLATTQDGLVRSSDGGQTWAPLAGPTLALLDWEREDRLWGVSVIGEVLRSGDGGATWSPAGHVPGAATALAAHGDELYVAVQERGIFHSTDAGTSWVQRIP